MHALTHLAEGGASHSPGRIDQYLFPYLKKDLAEDRISPALAQALLERMFVRFNERINVLSTEAIDDLIDDKPLPRSAYFRMPLQLGHALHAKQRVQ